MVLQSWDEIQGFQNEIARIMSNSHKLDRLSHSYIFEGPNGTKKKSTALLFAKSLLCTNPDGFNPCNVCHNCRRVDNKTHPNLFYVKPQGKMIRKNQIQELIDEFSKASVERGPRIYIIEDADKLNPTSANTLLKTMEEPGADIYQILITENINSLLKTIVSRAETLHFKPIDRNIIKRQLIENEIHPNIANAISQYTVDMGSAIKIARDESMVSIINLVIEIHKAFLLSKQSALVMFREQSYMILNDLDFTDFFLTLMIFYEKDVLNYQLHHFDELCFSEEEDTIKELSLKMSQKYIEENLAKMLGLKSRLKYNINNKLAFDKMLTCLERGYKYGTHCSSDTI
jgi:DNA polymerase III subunit delta'